MSDSLCRDDDAVPPEVGTPNVISIVIGYFNTSLWYLFV